MADINCAMAYHEMEERYSRLTVSYSSLTKKTEIFTVINANVEKHQITPEIVITPSAVGEGEYAIEFHDDYQKKAGAFYDDVLNALHIKICR